MAQPLGVKALRLFWFWGVFLGGVSLLGLYIPYKTADDASQRGLVVLGQAVHFL